MQTFVPGWNTVITFDSEDFTVVGNVLNFVRTKASLPKPVFGSQFRHEIAGQAGGSVSAEGHLSVEKVQALEDLFNSSVSIPYVIQAGEVGGDTDAGAWNGLMVVNEYTLDTDAEDQWSWSINATLDGAPVYTPPTP